MTKHASVHTISRGMKDHAALISHLRKEPSFSLKHCLHPHTSTHAYIVELYTQVGSRPTDACDSLSWNAKQTQCPLSAAASDIVHLSRTKSALRHTYIFNLSSREDLIPPAMPFVICHFVVEYAWNNSNLLIRALHLKLERKCGWLWLCVNEWRSSKHCTPGGRLGIGNNSKQDWSKSTFLVTAYVNLAIERAALNITETFSCHLRVTQVWLRFSRLYVTRNSFTFYGCLNVFILSCFWIDILVCTQPSR